MDLIEINSRDSILRWHAVFQLLSLERVASFLPEIGLDLSNIRCVQSVARSFLERYVRRSGDETEDKILLQETFTELTYLTNRETAQQLYQWGQQMFSDAGITDGRAFIWGILLRRLANISGTDNDLAATTLSERKINAIVHSIGDHLRDLTFLEHQVKNLEKLPKSDFEERIYQSYDQDTSPLDLLLDLIRLYRFHLIWERVKDLLSNEELELLLQWGKSQAQQMNIPLDLVSLPS